MQVKYNHTIPLYIALGILIFTAACDDGGDNATSYDYPWRVYELPELPDNSEITGIYMLSTTEGWACCNAGEVIKFNNSVWSVFCDFDSDATNVYLTSITFSGPSDGWIAGTRSIRTGSHYEWSAVVLHYDGGTWREVIAPPSASLDTVFAFAPDDVWAGGAAGIFHYDGSSWTCALAVSDITAICFYSPLCGAAVDMWGGHYRWDGVQWQRMPSEGTEIREGVAVPSPGSGWSVGGGYADIGEIPPEFSMSYYDDVWGIWRRYYGLEGRPADGRILHAVHFAAPDDGWAAGQVCLHYDGSRWTQIPLPPLTCAYSVFTLGGDEVWLGCFDRKILKYDPPQGRVSP